jgi:hypothetical protein
MTDEDDRLALRIDDALGRDNVAFEREGRILDDPDAVAVLPQEAVDALPAGAVDETPVDENDRAGSTHDALLREVGRGDREPRSVQGRSQSR